MFQIESCPRQLFYFHFQKILLSQPKIYKVFQTFWLSKWVSLARVAALLCIRVTELLQTQKHTAFELASPASQSCARELQQELGQLLSIPLIEFWNCLEQGLKLGLKPELCWMTNKLQFCSVLQNHEINCNNSVVSQVHPPDFLLYRPFSYPSKDHLHLIQSGKIQQQSNKPSSLPVW